MPRRGSLTARLRAEVQASTALWSDGELDGGAVVPYPCDVKPGIFFFKYLQPYEHQSSGTCRRLRLNLPLTVVAERTNGQEAVLGLETDAEGYVVRQEKAPIWRRKLFTDLLERAPAPPLECLKNAEGTAREVVLAVCSTSRCRPKISSDVASSTSGFPGGGAPLLSSAQTNGGSIGGRSTVVLTTATYDPVVNIPCDLPVCVQQFVRSRGLQASVYRIFWDENESKSYGINILNGLRFADALAGPPITNSNSQSSQSSAATVPVSIPSTLALSELAMARASSLSMYLCATMPTDAKKAMNLTKIRGKPVAEPLGMAKKIVEHVQLHLPGVHFRAMTVEFIRDAAGVWWFLSVVNFRAAIVGLEGVKESELDVEPLAKASAVHLAELQRIRQLCKPRGMPIPSSSVLGNAAGAEGLMTRSCFLCGSLCELSAALKHEVLSLMKDDPFISRNNDDTRELLNSIADYRMTIKMALETVYLLRQRGVVLAMWEAALQAVRRSPVQGVVEFSVCILCYRIFKHQQSLRDIAHELHTAFGSTNSGSCSQLEPVHLAAQTNALGLVGPSVGIGASGSSKLLVAGCAGSLNTELYDIRTPSSDTSAVGEMVVPLSPKGQLSVKPSSIVERIATFQREVFPSILLARNRANTPEDQHSLYEFKVVDGGAVDPSSTQMRLVFFFHELQDGGPELNPTDYYLEYQLGQCFNRIHLEGSKRHTPNRWQLCEARIHYFISTVEAFTTYCTDKKLLIKMKRRALSIDNTSTNENPAEDEFFGFAVLPFKPLITAAKWFGNSLLPESRSDYLLELHTSQFGLLTLKLTVGLLVDPVPLRNVRDIVCSRSFLEERAPIANIYWPPPTLCLSGLAIPRDWIGALMPSEYISVVPMRLRTHPTIHSSTSHRAVSGSSHVNTHRLNLANSSSSLGDPSDVRIRSAQISVSNEPSTDQAAGSSSTHISSSRTPLGRACMLARSLASRIADDRDVGVFPTVLLANVLRLARFVSGFGVSRSAVLDDTVAFRGWIKPASFHFTRRLSLDQLLSYMRAPLRPTLVLLGELLLVLRRSHFIPETINISALEELVQPFWLQTSSFTSKSSSGVVWQPVPRASAHMPEHRAAWNRAIRRCEAARTSSSAVLAEKELDADSSMPRSTLSPSKMRAGSLPCPASPLARRRSHRELLNSAFRYELQTLTLCELFEEMEALDNGYLDIAELRSLSKIYEGVEHELETWSELPNSLELVGTRERLTSEELVDLALQVDQQQRRTTVTILRSMLKSEPMVEALERFDQQGYGNLSFEDFRQLADDSLQADRDIFQAFRKEPTVLGFCIRHGATEVFAIDTICVQCTNQFINNEAESNTTSPESTQSLDGNEEGAETMIDQPQHDLQVGDQDASAESDSSDNERQNISSPDSLRDLPIRRRCTVTIGATPELSERHPAHDKELRQVLTRLEAAEWHVRYRQESMGKASFSQLIAEHSAQAEATRILARSPSVGSTGTSITEKTLHRSSAGSSKSVGSDSLSNIGGTTIDLEQKLRESRRGEISTPSKRKSSASSTSRKSKTAAVPPKVKPASQGFVEAATPSLSELLRVELGATTFDKPLRSNKRRWKARPLQTPHSTNVLIKKVSQTEAKRKKLDQLVLDELDEVKQRLARLMQES